MTHNGTRGTATRRQVLLGAGAGATVALAGCTGGGGGGADQVPVRGDPDADVVLEVYEDLGCPACRSYVQNGFSSIQSQYLADGLIRYEHRDFIVTGAAARQAASAAREALDRHGDDAFWDFMKTIYDNQNQLQTNVPGVFGDIASDLGLDAEEIQNAGENRAHDSAVDADIDRGEGFGVRGTPSFVLDEELIDTRGAGSMSQLVGIVAQEIDQALQQ